MKKGFKVLLAFILLCSAMISNMPQTNVIFAADVPENKEYLVQEDAFIRSGSNASKNYDYENITKAHGAQYEGKGFTVFNAKYGTDKAEIIGVMKFALPTLEELEKQYNHFELEYHIFKNADYNAGDQTYQFHYTTETNWKEKELTWNNKPASIDRKDERILFNFDIKQGDEYENKTDEEKTIKKDITETVTQLIKDGQKEMTVFVTAKNAMGTSLLIHSKETSDKSKVASILASKVEYTKENLQTLYDEYAAIKGSDYTYDSFQNLQTQLKEAKKVLDKEEPTQVELKNALQQLKSAYDALVKSVDPEDSENIAYQKPARSNLSKDMTKNVNDGKLDTYWSGTFYPSYVDIDLMDTYDLSEVKLFLPVGKVAYYSIYGSNDGKTYDRLYQKRDKKASTAEGDRITLPQNSTYRIIRVYMEYTQGDDKAYISEVKAYGKKQDSNTGALRKGSFEEISKITPYDQTDYAKEVTNKEVYENIYGIVDRTVGSQYRDWFTFEIAPNTKNDDDYFELSDVDGKIHIKGNKGITITTGLNYYYKNYANVMIAEQTMQNKMPDKLVKIGTTVRKETPYSVRYAYNYCTLSYTYAFFGEEEWQRENDWLALNGVNVVLDLAGQEAVWVKFLMNFGYSFDDAKDWLTGPAYYAWQFMDNMESFGGPIPDQYINDRVKLARDTQRWKNSLGMQTVLQGYAGMVPTNFKQFQPNVDVIKQGGWNGFSRPDMIATDSPLYDQYASIFYEAQEYVYGKTSNYYAVDPFHEGGIRPEGLGDATIADEVLNSMLEYDENAVWIVQGWQSNPTNELLKGMGDRREDHVLIIDLIKYPIESWTKYDRTNYGSTKLDAVEFNGTSWAWGLLANFGGNPSMHGQMQVMVDNILKAQKTSKHMVGIGIISEAMYDNPIMYDLIFDLAWADESFNLNQWMDSYLSRRYGGSSENIKNAWKIMKDANYDHGVRYTNELFGMKSKAPQDYGTQSIPYDASKLETAFKLLTKDYDKFKDSEGYRYDLTEIMRQMVSNYAVLTYNDVLAAKNKKDLEAFKDHKVKFLKAFDVLNEVQATQKEQLAGEWIGKAQDLAQGYDDFSKDTFELNAKTLITSWGSRSSHRNLKDYGWRNYEGMFLDLYKKNWEDYLNKVEKNLTDGSAIQTISASNYFDIYWDWNMSKQSYTRDAKDSAEEIINVVQDVLTYCTRTGDIDPNIGNKAINRAVNSNVKAKAGKLTNVTDGDVKTSLTVKAENKDGNMIKPEITIDLLGEFQVSELQVALDEVNKADAYELYASNDGKEWNLIYEKKSQEALDIVKVQNCQARFIKVKVASDSDFTLQELRVYGEPILPTLEQLTFFVQHVESLDLSGNSQDQITKYEAALKRAKDAITNAAAVDEINGVYWSLYDIVASLHLDGYSNVALQKTVTAHNDPAGNSARLVDGKTNTVWDSGRLSATGKPYEETITPGWAIIDLKDVYEINEMLLSFNNQNYWHNYELYVSLDQDSWTKVGEKTTKTLPNVEEDTYALDNVTARYVKLVSTNIQTDGSNKRYPFQVSELQVMGKKLVCDKEALQELLIKAGDIEGTEYTENSFKELQTEITKAQEVMDSVSANQETVDQMVESLQDKIDALVKRATTALLDTLKTAVQNAEAIKDDFTAIEFAKVQAAIDGAKTILSKAEDDAANTSAAAVQNAILAIAKAKDELIHNTLLDALRILVGNADAVLASDEIIDVRPGKVQALKDANEVAKALITSASTDIEAIKEASRKLSIALHDLQKIVDKSDIQKVITEIEKLHGDKYTESSWKQLMDIVEKAKKVVQNDDATKEDVEEAYNKLNMAIAELTLKVDKTALLEYIDIAEKMMINKNSYIPSSLQGMDKVIADAKAVANKADAKQSDIEKAVNSMIQAIAKARFKADVKELETLLKMMNSLDLSRYTNESKTAFETLLKEAQKLLENDEATQLEIEQMIIKLQESKDNLVNVTDQTGKPSDQKPGAKPNDQTGTNDVIANTGDHSNMALLGGLFLVSIAGAITIYKKRKK